MQVNTELEENLQISGAPYIYFVSGETLVGLAAHYAMSKG